MSKEIKASPEMKKFFEKLLKIKQHVKDLYDETEDNDFLQIYEMLDETIKEGK